MKKILIAIVSAFTAIGFGCGDASKEYAAAARETADSIAVYSGIATFIGDRYEEVWSDAIQNGNDFNAALQTERTSITGLNRRLANGKLYIDSAMKTLNEPPEKSAEVHKKLLEFYGMYSQLHSLAAEPSGSLMTYRTQRAQLHGEHNRLRNELSVMNLLTTAQDSAR